MNASKIRKLILVFIMSKLLITHAQELFLGREETFLNAMTHETTHAIEPAIGTEHNAASNTENA